MSDPATSGPSAAEANDGPGIDPELAAEQRHLDAAYARLDAMRRAAERVAEGYTRSAGVGRTRRALEREAAEANTRRRLASPRHRRHPPLLRPPRPRSPPTSRPDAAPFYIGRISVTDDDLTPLVVDWRAPVAEPFYRATAVEPMGVARRRHFQTHGRRLVGIDDEVFDADAATDIGVHRGGRGRAARRPRPGAHRADARHRRDDPGRAGRSDPRRPRRHPRGRPAAPAPARPRWRCTAPPTCCTRTASVSRRRACCSSARARSSCATSTKYCRRSAKTRSAWPLRPR